MLDFPQPLIDQARFERDTRAERYPRLVREGKVSAEAASIDYQCWVAIVSWLETGQFMGFHGGAEPLREANHSLDGSTPQTAAAPWISWPELVVAADSALVSVNAKAEQKPGDEALQLRRARLFAVHRKLQLRRESIDTLNAAFRARRDHQTNRERETA